MYLIEDKISELEGSIKKISKLKHIHINTEWRKQNLIRYMGYGSPEGEDSKTGIEQHLKR